MTTSHQTTGRILADLERPMLEAARERALLAAAREGDARAKAELVGAHLRLVRSVARRLTPRPSEDLVSEGIVGLLEAIERFDPTREVRLATYAAHWIRARVQQFLLANRSIVRAPDTRASRKVFARIGRARRALSGQTSEPSAEEIAHEIGVATSDVEGVLASQAHDVPVDTAHDGDVAVGTTPTPEDRYAEAELARVRQRAIDGALATLPDRERCVLESRTFAEDSQTLDQLARMLRLSRERVRQLEMRALRRVGDALTLEGLAA
jgi:RNA polymerase sigma-32 factor